MNSPSILVKKVYVWWVIWLDFTGFYEGHEDALLLELLTKFLE
jgi:nitric oxide reductase large subunit